NSRTANSLASSRLVKLPPPGVARLSLGKWVTVHTGRRRSSRRIPNAPQTIPSTSSEPFLLLIRNHLCRHSARLIAPPFTPTRHGTPSRRVSDHEICGRARQEWQLFHPQVSRRADAGWPEATNRAG